MAKKSENKYSGSSGVLMQDVLFSLLGSALAFLAVRWMSDPIPSFTILMLKWLGLSLAGFLIGALATGSHRSVRRYISFASIRRVIYAVIVKEIILVLSLVSGLVRLPSVAFCAIAILLDLIMSLFFLCYLRYAIARFNRVEMAVREKASRRVALVKGTSREAVSLAETAEAEEGYDSAGFITDDPSVGGRLIGRKVAFYCKDEDDLKSLMSRLGGVDCILFTRSEAVPDGDRKSGTPVANVADGMTRAGHIVKRGFDIALSGFLLIIFSPVMLVCAIAVRLEDGGPVIYSQERIGLHGRPFMIHKFRSMRTDAEKGVPALYQGAGDDRLTKAGRVLREHHLDELPQLWNVFVGDMSFIGYRPERSFYIEQIEERNPRYRFLYQIRPGVTSYATLYNGYTDTIDKMLTRLDLDLYYLRNHSLLFDAKVLGMTFLNIIGGKRF